MATDIFTLDNARTILRGWFQGQTICVAVACWDHVHDGSQGAVHSNFHASIFPVGRTDDCHLIYADTISELLDKAEAYREEQMGKELVDATDPTDTLGCDCGILPCLCPEIQRAEWEGMGNAG